MANYELSKFYEKTVLKPDEKVLKQLTEEALAVENTENKKLFVSLGEMYKETVLRVDETVVNPDLTDVYLNNLDALTDEQRKQIEQHPEYKKRLPHKLSLNQKRAIFESMSKEQYLKIQRERLDLENGMINPSDGGGNVDIDYIKYIQTANITDPFAQTQLLRFILGAKALGIWQNIVCWPLRLNQNVKTGSTVYSLGGFGSYPGTMGSGGNAPTRELNGMYFQSANSQYISTTLGNTVTAGSNYGLFCCADYSQVTSTAGSVVVAGGQRDLFNSGSTQSGSPSIIIGATNSTNIRIIADPGVNPILSVNTTAPTSGFAVFSALSNGTNVVINQNLTQLSNTAPLVPTPIGNNLIIGCTQSNQKFFNGRIQFVLAAFCPVDNTALYNLYNSTLGSGELDAPAYFARAGVTDPTAQSQITTFVTGIKNLGLWYNTVCWPLISTQNRGTGTTVYTFGGLGGDTNSLSGTLAGSPSWNTGGINFSQSPSYQWMTSSILQQLTAAGTTTFGLLGVADFSTVILSALPTQQFIGSRGLFGGGTNYLGIAAGRASLTDARVKTITDIDATGNFQPGGIPTGYSFMGSTANTNLTSYTPFIDDNSSLITGNSALSSSNNYTFAVGGTPGPAPQQGWYGNVAFAMAFSAPVANYNSIRTLYKSTLGSSLNLP